MIHNFSAIATELGAHDQELARFVNASAAVFRRFANQNENLGRDDRAAARGAALGQHSSGKIDAARQRRPRADLHQAAPDRSQALGPALEAAAAVLREHGAGDPGPAAPVHRARRSRRPRAARPATRDSPKSTPDLDKFTEVLNALFDELAYDPPGKGVGKERLPLLPAVGGAQHQLDGRAAGRRSGRCGEAWSCHRAAASCRPAGAALPRRASRVTRRSSTLLSLLNGAAAPGCLRSGGVQ